MPTSHHININSLNLHVAFVADAEAPEDPQRAWVSAHRIDSVRCYAVGMASMNEIFVWWPLIVAVPVTIVLGVAIAAMFSDKP